MKKVFCIIGLLLVFGGLTVHYDSGKEWYNTIDIRWRTAVLGDRLNIIRYSFEDKNMN